MENWEKTLVVLICIQPTTSNITNITYCCENWNHNRIACFAKEKTLTLLTNSINFFLVLKPPVITTPPKENIRIGSDVTLQCTSNGFPIPQFQWFNDNNVVVSVKSSLKLIGVTMATSGYYTCLANNGVSKEEKTIELIIPCEFHFLFIG